MHFTCHPMPPLGKRFSTSVGKRGHLILTWCSNGVRHRIGYHIYLWQLEFGPLPPGYVVHHSDKQKLNNDLGNLQAMTHEDHSALHSTKHGLCAHDSRSYKHEWYLANRDRVLAKQKTPAVRAHQNELRRARYQTGRKPILARKKLYRDQHREEINQYQAERRRRLGITSERKPYRPQKEIPASSATLTSAPPMASATYPLRA